MRQTAIMVLTPLVLAVTGIGPIAAREATPQTGAPEQRTIQLPDASIFGLSPDGQSIAAITADRRLCVYDVGALTERTCGDLAAQGIFLPLNRVVWSPDSARIAFTDEPFRYFIGRGEDPYVVVPDKDSDLWLMDAESGEITNLTDDGFAGNLPLSGEDEPAAPVHVDVLPAWAPDDQSIAFSRSTIVAGEFIGNEIARVDLASGEVERLVAVSREQPAVVYDGMAWAPDGRHLYYSVARTDRDDLGNGVWVYDAVAGIATHVLKSDPKKGPPRLARVAATGRTGLIIYYLPFTTQHVGNGEYYALLDLETTALAPVAPVTSDTSPAELMPKATSTPELESRGSIRAVTFSPDGTEVLYAVWHGEDREGQLLVRALPDGTPTVVANEVAGSVVPTTKAGGFVWADDGTVMLITDGDRALLLYLDPEPSSVPSE